MSDCDILRLSLGSRTLLERVLGDRPVEVGSASGCDLAVPSARVPPRALLVCPLHGSVFVHDLGEAPSGDQRRVMPIGEPFELGDGYRLTREKRELSRAYEPCTVALPAAAVPGLRLALIGDAVPGNAPVAVTADPVSVGTAPDNAIVVEDRTVSRHHCRIEPSPLGIGLRDLDSTNGTWVDGVRVKRVDLRVGASVRVGRSSFQLVEVGRGARDGVVAASAGMRRVMRDVERAASLPWPVLVSGETGVGKEVVARALHARGSRRNAPFVALNMGGLARELVESEMFGHERGAFTGAVRARRGAFEQANGGTLFLDEIGELPLMAQTRLLRVLETNEVRRLGGESVRNIDVRVVCATHADLRKAVRERSFREDLFYRIHRFVIEVPPLRKRKADILPLAEHLLGAMRRQVGVTELGKAGLERLSVHGWPGNVRELRNVLEIAALESHGGFIGERAVELALRSTSDLGGQAFSSDAVREALAQYGGNVAAAARALGLPRSTLRDRMRLEGIER